MRCAIELDFGLLDDLCFACEGGAIERKDLPIVSARTLGPLLELVQIGPTLDGVPIGTAWLDTASLGDILSRAWRSGTWYADNNGQGIIAVSTLRDDELAWTDFVIRARHGAGQSGFTSDHSGQIVAAIGEIYGNVIEHSGSVETGYVAYDSTPGRFEFVIADRGIGVLQSLRTNPAYAQLQDSGTALDYALRQGISRYTEAGHGNGFRPLFIGLANISRHVRFRSGNHGRVFLRQKDGSTSAQTIQLPHCAGLFCSVLCDVS